MKRGRSHSRKHSTKKVKKHVTTSVLPFAVTKKRFREFMSFREMKIPKGMYSQDAEHCFVRQPQINQMYCSVANTMTIADEGGSAPSGWTIQNVGAFAPNNVPSLQGGLSAQFAISYLPDYQDFTNLFNEWKIDKIELTMQPTAGDSYSSDGSLVPTLYTAIDYNDASVPTSLNSLKEYENCQETTLSLGHPVIRVFRPKPAIATYQGVTQAYGLPDTDSVWLDTSTPATLHYGFKLWFINWANDPANGYACRFQLRYFIVCRRPK